jgi:hypothetical protein
LEVERDTRSKKRKGERRGGREFGKGKGKEKVLRERWISERF